MAQAPFQTDNLDLALTIAAEDHDVSYTGPHDGVFRFESVKQKALAARDRLAKARSANFEHALQELVNTAREQQGRPQLPPGPPSSLN
jgi:hypothetical protein